MQLHQRKLYALRKRLQRYPQAVTALLQTAGSLNRPVDTLQPKLSGALGKKSSQNRYGRFYQNLRGRGLE